MDEASLNSRIYYLRSQINSCEDKICALKKDISELEEFSDSLSVLKNSFSSALDSANAGLGSIMDIIRGAFLQLPLSVFRGIVPESVMDSLSSALSRVVSEIMEKDDNIDELRRRIAKLQQGINEAYAQLNNLAAAKAQEGSVNE